MEVLEVEYYAVDRKTDVTILYTNPESLLKNSYMLLNSFKSILHISLISFEALHDAYDVY